jgi:Skp family chaperone for outer membrane proteins
MSKRKLGMNKSLLCVWLVIIAQSNISIAQAAEMMRIGYLNLAQIQASHPASEAARKEHDENRSKAALNEIALAAAQVANELGLDVVLDADGIYFGAQGIANNGVDITSEVAKKLNVPAANTLRGSATPFAVTLGYFNKAMVHKVTPALAEYDKLISRLEQELQNQVVEANADLKRVQDSRMPKADVQQVALDWQKKINTRMLQARAEGTDASQRATKLLATTAQQLANERGMNIITTGEGVFFGGNKILSSGRDLTREMISTLAGTAPTRPASPAVSTTRESISDKLRQAQSRAASQPDATAHAQIAILQLAMGDSAAVRQNADKALQMNPTEETKQFAIAALALAMLKDRDDAAARNVLNRAASECNHSIWTYRLLEYLNGTLTDSQLLSGQTAEQKVVSNAIIGFKKLTTGDSAAAATYFANAAAASPGAGNALISSWHSAAGELKSKLNGQ